MWVHTLIAVTSRGPLARLTLSTRRLTMLKHAHLFLTQRQSFWNPCEGSAAGICRIGSEIKHLNCFEGSIGVPVIIYSSERFST